MRELPSGWTRVALTDLVESATDGPFGSNLKTEHYVEVPGVRVVRLQNIGSGTFDDSDHAYVSERHARVLSRHEVRGGDLLVASLGDENHPVARACTYPSHLPPGIVKADCFRIRVKHELVLAPFMQLVLNSYSGRKGLAGRFQGVTRDRINLTSLLGWTITIPPIKVQRRIADIIGALDFRISSVDLVINKQLKALDGLTSALLAEDAAVVDPVRLGDALIDIEAGWSPLCEEIPPPPGKWGVLKVSAVTSGAYVPSESKILLPGMRPRPELEVHPGDLILCRANGVKSLVGVAALVRDTPSKLMLSDKLMRLVVDRSVVNNAYLELALASADVRRQIDAATSGSSGQNNISQGFVRALRVRFPSLSRQGRVVACNEAGRSVVNALKAERGKLLTLKQGLMENLLTGRVRVPEAEAALEDL
ncbi:hypothetical protein [Nocardia transvalensis]|uniref:hypothetical protein n=1 Tax=Nocardia transvalensis TaxID=37333 RepID=UPI001895DE44|nr:hypothetical protein [Nocardia transvalensis]MBF6332356.1 hypothetical protein [Nocardia transvalensis]